MRSRGGEAQPVADELLDRRRHAEELPDDGGQPFRVAHLAHQGAGVKELRQVGHRVAMPQRRRRDADERARRRPGSGRVRAVAVDVRLRLRPRAVEQREEAMMEEIEEPAERRIAGVPQPMARVLGDVDRQRAVRPEQAEQPDLQARRRAVLPELERGERSRRERHVGILSQSHRLVNRTERGAPARLCRRTDTPAAAASGRSRSDTAPWPDPTGSQSVGLVPQFGAHRLISPRLCDRNTVSVTELIDT